jgi:hypothetical protein
MPISAALKHHYGSEWRAISAQIRFARARGRCETCDRPHLKVVQTLADGQWYDDERHVWRDCMGHISDGPAGRDSPGTRWVRVVISAAHLDHDPVNRDPSNLAALCQRCHLRHDLQLHLARRWVTCRRRSALGDLFLGPYATLDLGYLGETFRATAA